MSVCLVFKILKTPGPGTYQPVDGINMDGQYAKSGHMRTRTPNMRKQSSDRPSKYDRIPGPDNAKPGPGWYDHTKQSLSMTSLNKAVNMTRTRMSNGFGSDNRKVFESSSCKCLYPLGLIV